MQVATGRHSEPLAASAFARLRARSAAVLVDVGCGDGAFPYRLAGAQPQLLCIGLDPNPERMAEYARKARRKPARGGRENLLYVVGALEEPPPELAGLADLIAINFPWAGLLQQVVTGDAAFADALHALAAPVSLLQILLNADADQPALPPITPARLRANLAPALARAGFVLRLAAWLPPQAQLRSRWGGRLIRGSRRRVVVLRAERGAASPTALAIFDAALGGPLPADA